jgi:lysophospholipase L1-like esterase
LVLKHRPKVVVVYAGDNDLAHGKTPEQVRDDLSAFLAQVRRQLPETRVVFLSIKPSISRWSLIDKQRRTNDLCRVLLERDPLAMFLDVGSVLLDDKGMPDPGYFLADGLHLNARGYERWAEILRPVLVKSMEG